MHAQQATREAEQENLQLGELLRHCMERLGLDADLTPFKHSPLPAPPPGGPMWGKGCSIGLHCEVGCCPGA